MNATERATERVQLRDRVQVLEEALRKAEAFIVRVPDHLANSKTGMKGWAMATLKVIDAALTPPPAKAPPAAFFTALEGDHVPLAGNPKHFAPPAETPAPTCANCKGAGRWWDTVRETYTPCQCGAAPVARDASGDGLSRCGRCDGYDPCLRCSDLGNIDRLRAELAAATKRADEAETANRLSLGLIASKDEEIARLKDEHHRVSNILDEAKHEAGRPPQPLANYIKDQRAAHAVTTARLGRARKFIEDHTHVDDCDCGYCIDARDVMVELNK